MREAKFQCRAQFQRSRFQPLAPFAIGAADYEAGLAAIFEYIAHAKPGTSERSIGSSGKGGETAIDDVVANLSFKALLTLGNCILAILPRVITPHPHAFGQGRVGVDVSLALAGDIKRACDRLWRSFGPAPAGKMLLHCRLQHFDRIIADNRQHCVFGHISALIKRAHIGSGRILKHGQSANGQARDIACTRRGELQIVLQRFVSEIAPVAPLGQNNAAFTVNRVFGNGDLARRLAHQHQGSVEQIGIIARQVEHIGDRFKAGRGIGVRTKGKPLALEQFDHFAFGNIGRAVERHMLKEMRQTQFAFCLFQ